MRSFRRRHFPRKSAPEQQAEPAEPVSAANLSNTGAEAAYLRSLVDSRATVTVVFQDGERLRGRIRYYDRDFFSVGPEGKGPNVFLRKKDVRYISEE